MTCIVGIETHNSVVIAGDSAGVADWEIRSRSDRKVFERDGVVMGFTSSFRMGQLLKYSLSIPNRPAEMNAHEYMATLFVDAVRECLTKGGYARKENEQESAGQFLVGYEGRLFLIGGDYQVGEFLDGYVAIGCGAAYALGALHALQLAGTPQERAVLALKAAAAFSIGVCEPFYSIEMATRHKAD